MNADLLHSESYKKLTINTLYRVQNQADAPSGWRYTIFVDVTETWGNLLEPMSGRHIKSRFTTSDGSLIYWLISSGYRGFIRRTGAEVWHLMELDETGIGPFRRARLAAQIAANESEGFVERNI